MSSNNPETMMTLDDAVEEVLGLLTGLDLSYDPRQDRYGVITRQLNRALRANALEQEWGWYHDTFTAGTATQGENQVILPVTKRPRITSDDAVRLVDDQGVPHVWAYFLPRDAGHKYRDRPGLWVTSTRNVLTFSRPFYRSEDGLEIQVPVQREPVMFRLPEQPEDPNAPLVEVPDSIRNQPIDFSHPDLVILRAAYFYAQTDPVMQPRVQTIEAQYKDLMYQVMERDESFTDSPYTNEFILPVQNDLTGPSLRPRHLHPHSDGWR